MRLKLVIIWNMSNTESDRSIDFSKAFIFIFIYAIIFIRYNYSNIVIGHAFGYYIVLFASVFAGLTKYIIIVAGPRKKP